MPPYLPIFKLLINIAAGEAVPIVGKVIHEAMSEKQTVVQFPVEAEEILLDTIYSFISVFGVEKYTISKDATMLSIAFPGKLTTDQERFLALAGVEIKNTTEENP